MNNTNNNINANTVAINLNVSVDSRDALFEQSKAICVAIRKLKNTNNYRKDNLCKDIEESTFNIIYGTSGNQLGMPSYLSYHASQLAMIKSQLEGTGIEYMLDPIIKYAQDSAEAWQRTINGDMFDEFDKFGGQRKKIKKKTRKTKKTRTVRKNYKN